jgi:hypothetical protein
MRALLVVIPLVLSLGAASDTPSGPTFREAASEAQGIARVRVAVTGDSAATFFTLVEVIRGQDLPKTIVVSSELWRVHRPKPTPTGDVTYLVLLKGGEELLCGHMNGMIILSHSCVGIVPVIEDKIPAEYVHSYDREATQAIAMTEVRKQLRQRK